MKSKADKLALNAGTTALIVILIVLLLSLFSVSIWGYCGTDSAAVNLRDKFAIVQQQIERFANGNETVIVPPDNPFETEVKFKKIGNGVAIDKFAIGEYIGNFTGDRTTIYYVERDRDGQYAKCLKQDDCTSGICSDEKSTAGGPKYCLNVASKKVSEFRSSLGFIPPSFAFYPYGKSDTNYKYYNTGDKNDPNNLNVKGNNICMRACSDTNCAAVQIGVPENCAMKKSETLENSHSCGISSEASCTLFYNTIEESDDAYYNLYNQKLSTGRSDYLGEKYYLLGEKPELTPSAGYLPNGENTPVKWCPSYMPPPKNYNQESVNPNLFNTAEGADAACKCGGLNSGSQCTDTNCCKYRPLLTTNGTQAARPYYNIPINFLQKKACAAIQTSTGECCGVCYDEDGRMKFSSCEGKLKGLAGGSTPTWDTANIGPNGKPESSMCEDEDKGPKDKIDIACYGEYLVNVARLGKEKAALKLQGCNCKFRTRSCIVIGIQPTCLEKDDTNVQRGCVGDPPILITDQVNITKDKSGKIIDNGIGACDDMSVVPRSFRCEYDDANKLCTGFAYGCGLESGSLWVRDDAPIS